MKLNNVFSSLRRVTSKGDFIPEIDGLRFLAIFPVVLMHANTNYKNFFGKENTVDLGIFNQVLNHGGLGVWIFFAISGFILSYFFANHFHLKNRSFSELNLKAYYLRRLTRLEPPFLLSTIVLYFFTGLFVAGGLIAILPNLLATLTYSHYLVYGKWSVINPVTWSLEAEVQFYIIAPFLCAFFFSMKEWLRNILLCLFIILLPVFVFLPENSIFVKNPHFSRTIPVYMSHFLIGVLMASIYTGSIWLKINKGRIIFDLVGILALIGLFYFLPNKANLITYFMFDLCVLLVMIGSFKGRILNIIFSNQVLTTIGGMCYSIYLLHYAVMYGLMKFTRHIVFPIPVVNYLFHMLLSLSVVMFISILFFKYCEKPFMYKDWPQKVRQVLGRKLSTLATGASKAP